MIVDTIENLDLYVNVHPSFAKVFDYLKNLDFSNLQVGKTEVDSDFYMNVDEVELRNIQMANLEVHDSYIDIQIPVAAPESIGYKPRKACKYLKEMHPKKDITFYKDRFDATIYLPVGSFAIFFPQDAHAPIIGNGMTKKIVLKVKK